MSLIRLVHQLSHKSDILFLAGAPQGMFTLTTRSKIRDSIFCIETFALGLAHARQVINVLTARATGQVLNSNWPSGEGLEAYGAYRRRIYACSCGMPHAVRLHHVTG